MQNKKERKIVFIDQTSEFDHHMVFNACIIKILLNVFKSKVDYYSVSSSKQSVYQLFSIEQKDLISFYSLKYSKPIKDNILYKIYNYLKKERLRYNSFKRILNNSKDDDIIFLSITTFTSFLAFKILKKKHNQNVVTFLHGDIDFLYNSKGFLEKLNGFSHKLIFKIKARNFYFCVLNKIAKERLVFDGFLTSNELLEINHPVESKNKVKNKRGLEKQLVLGHIGSLELERKNSHLFYKLALSFYKEIDKKDIFFRAIGLSTPSMKPFKNRFVQDIVGNNSDDSPKYLDRNTYETSLLELDYALFFYPEKEYVFRASGAITDAIALQIPIITLRHPYFEYLFKIGGDIGYICESLAEVKNLITKISNQKNIHTEKYKNQVVNLKTLYQVFNIANVAEDFKNQLNSRNII
jgi:hypothetical protein